jgi:hypothetical protein
MDLTGRWHGAYVQHDRSHGVSADITQAGDRLTGFMRDHDTASESTVFEAAAEAGLPPGADEEIVANLRRLAPESSPSPIRYVSQLPAESSLEGSVVGNVVRFVKTYLGTSLSGYRVGERVIGSRREGHSVHYWGQVSVDGDEIIGEWFIEADATKGERRTSGPFHLRREEATALTAIAAEQVGAER